MRFMEISAVITEYYDELFPVTDELKKFYEKECLNYDSPVKFLRIGCGTGAFEHFLAKNGADVTGTENFQNLLDSANRKRRTQLMSLRFFNMTTLEISRYLGKGFYNVISILDGRILFTKDNTLMAKLFYDCRNLLSEGGKFIISLPNFEKYEGKKDFFLPARESIRARCLTKISQKDEETYICSQKIERGSGALVSIFTNAEINFLTRKKIEENAKQAGFFKLDFYSDFSKNPLSFDSANLVAVMQA